MRLQEFQEREDRIFAHSTPGSLEQQYTALGSQIDGIDLMMQQPDRSDELVDGYRYVRHELSKVQQAIGLRIMGQDVLPIFANEEDA